MGRLGLSVALALAVSFATAPGAGAAVKLNEVNCEGTDWVELVNPADEAADVSNWLLTDDPLEGTRPEHRFVLPAGTTVPGQGTLVLEKGGSGFPFGVSCGGDTLRLADAGGALADEIAVPTLTDPAETWGRYPNASGPWVQTASTRGAPNQPSASSPPGDQAAWLFDPGKVAEVDLTIPQSSREALDREPTEYQPATFALTTTGGTYGPLEVGVRLKGGLGSFRPLPGKAAFKVKFGHSVPGQRFAGLKTLTLNNMVQDPSMVHEVLAYEAFRAAGVPAPRTGYAFVRVNGADFGLYLDVETLDEIALRRHFGSTRHLYEGEYGEDLTPGSAPAFEVDEGSESDRADLEALIGAVNGAGAWSNAVGGVTDLDEMVRMWAVEKYIGHWDGYAGVERPKHPNNYFLHSDGDGRFSMLPWGTDQTFIDTVDFGGPAGLMFDRCLADADCAGRYRRALREVAAAIERLDLDRRLTEQVAVVSPWQARHPEPEWGAFANDWVQRTRAFISRRPGQAAAWLDPPDPADPPARPPARPSAPSHPATVPGRFEATHSLRSRFSLARVLRSGLRTRTRCSRACLVWARLLLPRRLARRLGLGSGAQPVRLAQQGTWLADPGGRTMTLRFGRRGRRALRGARSVPVVVQVAARDSVGRVVRAERRVKLGS